MSKYGILDPGTCLPALEAIKQVYPLKDVLEFGAGYWSTGLFLRNEDINLISIEHDSEWVNKLKAEFSHKNNFQLIHWTKSMYKYLDVLEKDVDLIFIDGEDRIECLQKSFFKAPIIVCHDTHQPSFAWELIAVPPEYKQLTYIAFTPYLTTIFYHADTKLKDAILDVNYYSHKNSFIDLQYWSDQDLIELHRKHKAKK